MEIMTRFQPDGWALRSLGQVFVERKEKGSDQDFPALSVTMNGVVPQLDTAAKTDRGDDRKVVRVGDYVINSRSDRKGSGGISDLEGSVSLISIVMKPTDIDPKFAHHLLRSVAFQEEFYRFGRGIVADLWSTRFDDLKRIKVYLPSSDQQNRIATYLDRETARIDALIEKKTRFIELLKEKRQVLITQAVTKGLDPTVPMKDSGVEWIGEVPAHWETTRVGWIATYLSYGFTNPMPSADDGPHMLTANDVGDMEIRWDTCRRTSENAWKYAITNKSRPIRNDILITKDGTLGRIGIADGRDCCINQSVALLRINQKKALPEFVAYALAGSTYQERMIYEAGGTTIKHIYISRLAHMPFAIPPIKEQRAILHYARAKAQKVVDAMNQTQRSIDLLKERRSALITAAVTGQIDLREDAA